MSQYNTNIEWKHFCASTRGHWSEDTRPWVVHLTVRPPFTSTPTHNSARTHAHTRAHAQSTETGQELCSLCNRLPALWRLWRSHTASYNWRWGRPCCSRHLTNLVPLGTDIPPVDEISVLTPTTIPTFMSVTTVTGRYQRSLRPASHPDSLFDGRARLTKRPYMYKQGSPFSRGLLLQWRINWGSNGQIQVAPRELGDKILLGRVCVTARNRDTSRQH